MIYQILWLNTYCCSSLEPRLNWLGLTEAFGVNTEMSPGSGRYSTRGEKFHLHPQHFWNYTLIKSVLSIPHWAFYVWSNHGQMGFILSMMQHNSSASWFRKHRAPPRALKQKIWIFSQWSWRAQTFGRLCTATTTSLKSKLKSLCTHRQHSDQRNAEV